MEVSKITINLVDGSAYGPRVVEIGNWTGMGFFCPKEKVEKVWDREEWKRSGVYCLRFEDPVTKVEKIYWGQALVIAERIEKHYNQELKTTNFTELIFFTSSSLSFGPTQISYLEHRLITMARDKGIPSHNVQLPRKPPINEADTKEMETFLKHILLLLPIMGFRFMVEERRVEAAEEDQGPDYQIAYALDQPLPEMTPTREPKVTIPVSLVTSAANVESVANRKELVSEVVEVQVGLPKASIEEVHEEGVFLPYKSEVKERRGFWISRLVEVLEPLGQELIQGRYRIKSRTLKATMDIDRGHYLVYRGSQSSKTNTNTLGGTYVMLRAELVRRGILEDRGDHYVFTKDCRFNSSSGASNAVLGRQSSGSDNWINDKGATLGQVLGG